MFWYDFHLLYWSTLIYTLVNLQNPLRVTTCGCYSHPPFRRLLPETAILKFSIRNQHFKRKSTRQVKFPRCPNRFTLIGLICAVEFTPERILPTNLLYNPYDTKGLSNVLFGHSYGMEFALLKSERSKHEKKIYHATAFNLCSINLCHINLWMCSNEEDVYRGGITERAGCSYGGS